MVNIILVVSGGPSLFSQGSCPSTVMTKYNKRKNGIYVMMREEEYVGRSEEYGSRG